MCTALGAGDKVYCGSTGNLKVLLPPLPFFTHILAGFKFQSISFAQFSNYCHTPKILFNIVNEGFQ